MCQQKTVYLCKHSSYRKIRCSAKKAQRSSCFFLVPPPPCVRTVSSQPSTQLCPNCLRKDRNKLAMEAGERQRTEQVPTRSATSMQGFHAQLPQQPQAARLRLEPERLGTAMSSGHRALTTDQYVPTGIDLSSVAADAFHFVQNMPLQQPSHLIAHVQTTPSVPAVSSGFADAGSLSPRVSVEKLRAEARQRVLNGLGNFF